MHTNSLDRAVAVNVESVVHVMLELEARAAVAAERAPIGAVVVLERSGRCGAPLHAVCDRTCDPLRLLGPNDRLGVGDFVDDPRLVLPLA